MLGLKLFYDKTPVTVTNFVNLSKLINQYSLNQSTSITSAYSLNGTLRSAAKKYGVFKYPELTEAYRKRVYYHY